MRTFIAIDLSPEIKAKISDFLQRLKRLDAGKISWVKEHGMHLTLKFLGEIDGVRVESVKGVLREVCLLSRSFRLAVKGTGFFPPGGRAPRVLWVGVLEHPDLLELQSRLESGLETLGFPRENRPFHPHLTLGRVKSSSGLTKVLAELEKARDLEFGEMDASKVALILSTLKPAGAEHTPLEEVPLP